MNNTIDFKTAKTIDSMSKKLDHMRYIYPFPPEMPS